MSDPSQEEHNAQNLKVLESKLDPVLDGIWGVLYLVDTIEDGIDSYGGPKDSIHEEYSWVLFGFSQGSQAAPDDANIIPTLVENQKLFRSMYQVSKYVKKLEIHRNWLSLLEPDEQERLYNSHVQRSINEWARSLFVDINQTLVDHNTDGTRSDEAVGYLGLLRQPYEKHTHAILQVKGSPGGNISGTDYAASLILL